MNNYDENNTDLTGSEGEINAPDNLSGQETSEAQASDMAIAPFAFGDSDDSAEYPQAPFKLENSGTENVELNSASVSLSITDFVLPGKNGFDFKLTRYYNSSHSVETDRYSSSLLGLGWQGFGFPSVSATYVSSNSLAHTLYLGDGRVYALDNQKSAYTNQIKRSLSDILFYEMPSRGNYIGEYGDPNRKQYTHVLAYKDGKKAYFMASFNNTKIVSFKLVAMSDRFDNFIFFNLTFPNYTIVDTLGRTISLTKDGQTLKWILPDKSTIKYTVEDRQRNVGYWKGNNWHNVYQYTNLLTQVEDQAGRVTKYEYGDEYVKKIYIDEETRVYYRPLTKITYPTGAVTKYVHEPSYQDIKKTKRTDTVGMLQLISREDRESENATESKNLKGYTYQTKVAGNNDKARLYVSCGNVIVGNTVDEYHFEDKKLPHEHNTKINCEWEDGELVKSDTVKARTIQYYRDLLPAIETVTQYQGSGRSRKKGPMHLDGNMTIAV